MSDERRDFATHIVTRLRDEGYEAYFAGGCVRDLLRHQPPKDYDVATSARPEQVRELFGRRKTVAVGESFGVILVVGPREAGQVEVATFRSDLAYVDGRRPTGVIFSSPEEDALRRDFTINGMFYDPIADRILDFVGGQDDLDRRLIRAIRDPLERMREDKLRMLRAVRFAATLEFEIEQHTFDAVRAMAGELPVVSAERITQELRRMLADPHRKRAVTLAAELGLLAIILPELSTASGNENWTIIRERLARLSVPSFEGALAILLSDQPISIVDALAGRWKLSNHEADRLRWLMEHQTSLHGADGWSMARLKRLLAHPDRELLLAVASTCGPQSGPGVSRARQLLDTLSADELDPAPLMTGADLKQLGLVPGPRFREWLDLIRNAQLNGEIQDRQGAIALLEQLQASRTLGTPGDLQTDTA